MDEIGVWSAETGLADRLAARLDGRFAFLPGSHPATFAGHDLALLIISPTATGLAGAGVIQPRTALLPGGNPALARQVSAPAAVSYGLGRQNTLTLSSLEGGTVSLALQRELTTLSGQLLEPQEWVLPFDRAALTPEEFLCLTGALLLCGETL